MTAEIIPLYMEQGATFRFGFAWHRESEPPTDPPTLGEPYDLATFVTRAQMQVRQSYPDEALIDIASDGPLPCIVFGALGHIEIIIPGSKTQTLALELAMYDLEITLAQLLPNGEPDIRRLMEGPVHVGPNVTRE